MTKQDMRNFGYLVAILTRHIEALPKEISERLNHPVWYAEKLTSYRQTLANMEVKHTRTEETARDKVIWENTENKIAAICKDLQMPYTINDSKIGYTVAITYDHPCGYRAYYGVCSN